MRRVNRAGAWSAALLAVIACETRERLEPLGVDAASPRGRNRLEMMLRTGGKGDDAWVARVHRRSGRPVDVTLPSLPSNEGDRSVSQRKPRIIWDASEERALVETIRSAFVVLYVPPDSRPFVCEHRVVNPADAYEALTHTPTLAKLEEEILTEDDKPHDAEEQEYVLGRLERAGATSEAAAALVPAILRSSGAIDRSRLVRLTVARLRPGGGLPDAVRDSELARLRTALVEFAATPDRDRALRVPRVVEVLAALPREEGEAPIVPALEAAVARSATATAMADVLPAVGPLAWLAGKWRLGAAAPALTRYLGTRDEVPFQTRVARNVALWASVRLETPDALLPVLPLVEDPIAWTTGGERGEIPADADAEASAAWAEDTTLGVVFAWAAVQQRDARAIAALRSALGRSGVPAASAMAAARALLALDETTARPVIRASPALSEAAKRSLLEPHRKP